MRFGSFVLLWGVCFWNSVVVVPLSAADSPAQQPVPLIIDADMESDCDDVAALAVAHVLADRGECQLLAVVSCARNPWTVSCIDAVNTYFGRGDLPIGQVAQGVDRASAYTRYIAEHFPNDLKRDEAEEAVSLYRRLLASAEDGSITIVTLGYLTNLRDLLASKADRWSDLDGVELVRKKVKICVCMGSRYPADAAGPGVWGNFRPDPQAAISVARDWPTVIHFTGGGEFAHRCGSGETLRQLPEENPVRKAYELFFGEKRSKLRQHSADQIAIWIAVRGTEPFFTTIHEGQNEIDELGRNRWVESPNNPRHQYTSALKEGISGEQVSVALNELMTVLPKGKQTQSK